MQLDDAILTLDQANQRPGFVQVVPVADIRREGDFSARSDADDDRLVHRGSIAAGRMAPALEFQAAY